MRKISILRFGLSWLLLGLASAALAAQMSVDEVLRDFKVNGDYMIELDGKVLRNAEIFFSERAAAYLVMAPELASPLMISPRTRAVETVHLMKVMKKADGGSVDILADAELTPVSSFKLQDSNVVFDLDGKEARLMPRPWLLGLHKGERLKEHNPEYAYAAGQYHPITEHIEALRALQKDVKVRVYFGSWCPHCKRIVPRILRVEDELEGSNVRFEYYGLPSPFTDEPEAVRAGIQGVPTMVISVDGEETATITGNDLNVPEGTLRRTLAESEDGP